MPAGLPLDEIAAWAAEHHYQALEVATSSATGSRDAAVAHLDVADFDEADADRVRALFDRHRLELSAFAYHENNLHPDEHRRNEIATHLRHTIDAASLLGVPYRGRAAVTSTVATALRRRRIRCPRGPAWRRHRTPCPAHP